MRTRFIRPGGRPDNGVAFFQDFDGEGRLQVPDAFAEELAEEFLTSATSDQEHGGELFELVVDDEGGGPFIITTRKQELARSHPGYDGGDSEAFPTTGPTPPVQLDDRDDSEEEF